MCGVAVCPPWRALRAPAGWIDEHKRADGGPKRREEKGLQERAVGPVAPPIHTHSAMDTNELAPVKTKGAASGSGVPAHKKEPSMKLIGYNLLSGCLWSFALLNVVATAGVFGDLRTVFKLTHVWTTAIQLLAVVEIYNSATGLVRSPLFTTVMQVTSRLVVVLGVWTLLPEAAGNASYAYLSVHVAWGLAEVVRYYYYATNLMSQQQGNPTTVPPTLEWLRYNAFIVLYPLGISSECYMIYYAVAAAAARDGVFFAAYALFLCLTLVLYVPGTVVLFSHMLKQRAKFNAQRRQAPAKKTL